MESAIAFLLPMLKSAWAFVSKEIKILKQKGELTPELEAQYQETQKAVFADASASIDPDPTT